MFRLEPRHHQAFSFKKHSVTNLWLQQQNTPQNIRGISKITMDFEK
jgi:hypothetical protein